MSKSVWWGLSIQTLGVLVTWTRICYTSAICWYYEEPRCRNVSNNSSDIVSMFIVLSDDWSTPRMSAILALSIPETANSLKKSISSPVKRFRNAGQNPLHHWGKGHNSMRWWLQLAICFAERWERRLPRSSGKNNREIEYESVYIGICAGEYENICDKSGIWPTWPLKSFLLWQIHPCSTSILLHSRYTYVTTFDIPFSII